MPTDLSTASPDDRERRTLPLAIAGGLPKEALDDDDVPPGALEARMTTVDADLAEAGGAQEGAAGVVRREDPAAAMGLAYLAVEGLVTHVLGAGPVSSRSSLEEWEQAGPFLATTREDMLRLLWSTQLGRHVDPIKAKKRLRDESWPPLGRIQLLRRRG